MKKRNTITGQPLNFNAGIQKWYEKQLLKLVDELTKDVLNEIRPLYKEYKEQITFDASISSQARMTINSLRKLFEKKFKDKGKKFAESMVRKTNRYATNMFKQVMASLFDKEKVKETGFTMAGSIVSPEKEEVVKALVFENVSLIKSINDRYFEQITGAVMRSIENGDGLTSLTEEIMKYNGMNKRRARLIALDQTRKAYNSINLRNMQETGVKKFKWIHSGGSKEPRLYHRDVLNGQIFDIDTGAPNDADNPEYIYPGQLPYCRCRMAPVIEFDLT
jgi:SPP1 gp7 family putative phage head morphogenesis protein